MNDPCWGAPKDRMPHRRYLTEYDPVWPMAEGCFEEVADAHSRQSVLWLPGFKADEVGLVHLNFGRVFNEKNSFVWRNEFPEDI